MIAPWLTNCARVYAVGNMPTVVFTFVPHALHPLAIPSAVTVTVKRPDGTVFGAYTVPNAAITLSTTLEVVDGVSTNVTEVAFEFPTPFDVGSNRKPWLVTCVSSAGVVASKTATRWVNKP